MKKIFVLLLSLVFVFTFVGCNKEEDAMTYAEYAAAKVDDTVVIEAYVQAKQGWWQDKATIYTQDSDGAYFLYELPCTEEDYNKLVIGTKIRVTGKKADYQGEKEIIDATYTILKGSYIAPAFDVTSLIDKEELINHQNKFVAFKGFKVEPSSIEGDTTEYPFLYKYNGSGSQGDDLYFKVSLNGKTYTFTVESYLCGKDTEVYKAVEALKIGDVVDMEGFLYWYNGVNPHITKVTVK